MDAFEALVAMLLRHQGYWVSTNPKVKLTKAEKKAIGTPSMPRHELDLVAYKGSTNELLIVECKSFLDSLGVRYRGFDGSSEKYAKRYKLFNSKRMRDIVFTRLKEEMVANGACAPNPSVKLALATGKIVSSNDREKLHKLFKQNGWLLLDEEWLAKGLSAAADTGYENDIACVVSKLLLRKKKQETEPTAKIRRLPKQREQIPVRMSFTKREMESLKKGFVPTDMNEKWYVQYEDGWLNLVRSWTGYCIFRVKVKETSAGGEVVEAWANRNKKQYEGYDAREEVRMIAEVIRMCF